MTLEWSYVCDKDGCHYVIRVPEKYIIKSESREEWIKSKDAPEDASWWSIDTTNRISDFEECIIDFEHIPEPHWEDARPITIIQHITTTFYINE